MLGGLNTHTQIDSHQRWMGRLWRALGGLNVMTQVGAGIAIFTRRRWKCPD